MKEVRFAQKSFKSIKNLSVCISIPWFVRFGQICMISSTSEAS